MSRITKIELSQANAKLAAENDALRHECSALRAQCDALRTAPVAAAPVARPKRQRWVTLLRTTSDGLRYNQLVGRTDDPRTFITDMRKRFDNHHATFCLVAH